MCLTLYDKIVILDVYLTNLKHTRKTIQLESGLKDIFHSSQFCYTGVVASGCLSCPVLVLRRLNSRRNPRRLGSGEREITSYASNASCSSYTHLRINPRKCQDTTRHIFWNSQHAVPTIEIFFSKTKSNCGSCKKKKVKYLLYRDICIQIFFVKNSLSCAVLFYLYLSYWKGVNYLPSRGTNSTHFSRNTLHTERQ